ncbi:hypothetical protein GE061_001687 [Apolygus lucorum]|uniref:Uncharacterized protein n=1 Tax=Apolygus lucorum TaxID=248454 RepID=A0A6A4KFZ1_APOLU|nr:hypothetical protein GE061_001687 [Apolygus lucorum]
MKGQSVVLQANYFQFNTKTDMILYQYKVDFNPDIDATFVKKDVLSRIKDDFGQYLFDDMKGQSVVLQANYFQFNTKTDMILYQYKVDFNPDIDATFVKRDVLSRIKDDFGQYLFDGTVLITTTKLRQERF